VVPRATQIARRTNDGRGGVVRQTLVANVDTALLLMGLDHDYNLRRLDRYLALARTAGIDALVVLTKADGCADVASKLVQVGHRLRPAEDAVAVDGRNAGVRALFGPWLAHGRTVVLLGSSGSGKSTLTNTLVAAELQDTGAVRSDDSRGRHTTTARTLHRCAGGACIIDTPGLRALRLDAAADDIGATFDDIASLAAQCRFRDCRHAGEPGCAVRDRVAPERLSSFHKLRSEARRDSMTLLEKREQIATWKMRARAMRLRVRCGTDA
jgi:ribosome biogenesis GTPase